MIPATPLIFEHCMPQVESRNEKASVILVGSPQSVEGEAMTAQHNLRREPVQRRKEVIPRLVVKLGLGLVANNRQPNKP